MGDLLNAARGVQPQGQPTAAGADVDIAKIHNDPAFQRLDPGSQQRVLSSLGVQTQSPVPLPSSMPSQPKDMPIESAVPGELKKSLVDPTYRLLTGHSQGIAGTTEDVMGTGQLLGAGAAFIAGGGGMRGLRNAGSVLLAPTVGATVRGLLTDFNATAGWSGFLGGLAEVATGGAQALSGWRGAMKTAKGLVEESTAGGAVIEKNAAQVLKRQSVGTQIIDRANAAFEQRSAPISRVIDGMEKEANKLTAVRGDPTFADVEHLVSQAKDFRVSTPEIAKLERDLQTGQINLKDVVDLRKELEGDLNYAKSAADPNIPANKKLARAVRAYATTAISTALGPEAGGRYGEALIAWRSQVTDPKRILRAVMAKNLEPSTAFELVYGGREAAKPEVIQTLSSLKDVDPDFRSVLRLGAMQHLYAAAGGDLRQSAAGGKAFNTLGPMLGTTGLFQPEELAALKLFMRPGMVEEAMSRFAGTVSGREARIMALALSASVGTTSGSAIYHVVANHPQLGFLAVAASGGLGALRRVMLAPPGSPVSQASAAAIVRGLNRMGSSLANRPSAELDD